MSLGACNSSVDKGAGAEASSPAPTSASGAEQLCEEVFSPLQVGDVMPHYSPQACLNASHGEVNTVHNEQIGTGIVPFHHNGDVERAGDDSITSMSSITSMAPRLGSCPHSMANTGAISLIGG